MVGDARPLELGRELLTLNEQGIDLQFDPTDNVQICKYGWGAVTLLELGDQSVLPAVLRMVSWYDAAQRDDGSWHPSDFLVPSPDDADGLGKTAEHLMHISLIGRALQVLLARAHRRTAHE